MNTPTSLRICHVASGDLWGGAEVQLALLLRVLNTFADLRVSAILFNKGKLLSELQRNGIPVSVYDEQRVMGFSLLRSLRRHFDEWRPDIVHTHRYKENLLGGLAAKSACGAVVVQTIHGLDERLRGWPRLKMAIYSQMNKAVTRAIADGIVCVSQDIAEQTTRMFPKITSAKIPNGIDLRTVRPTVARDAKRKELGIGDETFLIGTACRLMPVKGIEYLLQAVQFLSQRVGSERLKLFIAGDGPLRSELQALACRLGIERCTMFLGGRDDVYDLMSACDVYALPSLHEGVPMALLEAMRLGCAVVASNVGGIAEVVQDRISGWLVPPQDVPALADALRELLDSPELRFQYGQKARERVERDFHAMKMASETRLLYLRLAERRATT